MSNSKLENLGDRNLSIRVEFAIAPKINKEDVNVGIVADDD